MSRKNRSTSSDPSVMGILRIIHRAKARSMRDRLTKIIAEAPVIMNDDPEENARLEREVKAAMERYSKRARRPRRAK